MELTNEQIERILVSAPEGATHWQYGYEIYYICGTALPMAKAHINGGWVDYPIYPNMSALSDLREILALRQREHKLVEKSPQASLAEHDAEVSRKAIEDFVDNDLRNAALANGWSTDSSAYEVYGMLNDYAAKIREGGE